MPNSVNYATQFLPDLMQKYSRELRTAPLTSQGLSFVGANAVRIPTVSSGGYKMHSRAGGFNRRSVSNSWQTKTLAFDRDAEQFVDSMDVDETNQALVAASMTNTFLSEHDIPETDAYRLSKLFCDYCDFGGSVNTDTVTAENILELFDEWSSEMDDAGVPQEGRVLFMTPACKKLLKQAAGISRALNVGGGSDEALRRQITALDNTAVVDVPSGRMKTAFDFTDGFVPAASARDIHMMLVHPSAVIAADKHSYIRLWPAGTHTHGDGWLFQIRKYGDLFVLENRLDGIRINAGA